MKLYEVQATEYNGEQEYFQSKLLTAENIDQARQIARDYFRQWYDDGDEPKDHNTDNPDEFEFINGCIRLRIKSVQETNLDEWVRTRITLHSISALPDELITTRITGSAADLLEACKVLTSYTTDLLYRLDGQVNISDIEEIQQARDAIDRYDNLATQPGKFLIECFISEQCSDGPRKKLSINIMAESGKLWIQPAGYGDKTSADGHGWPIGLEIWQGRLRLIIFNDINIEEPKIIDIENARETARMRCNWCKKEIDTEPIKWKSLLFCSEPCLDECRAAQ